MNYVLLGWLLAGVALSLALGYKAEGHERLRRRYGAFLLVLVGYLAASTAALIAPDLVGMPPKAASIETLRVFLMPLMLAIMWDIIKIATFKD